MMLPQFIPEMPEVLRRFIIFCGVGVFNMLVGYTAIMIFHNVLGLHYLASNSLGYFVSVVAGYITHRNITYRDRKTGMQEIVYIIKHFRKFSFVFTVCYMIQLGSVFVMVDWFGFWFFLAQAIAALIYVVASYIGTSLYTFRKAE